MGKKEWVLTCQGFKYKKKALAEHINRLIQLCARHERLSGSTFLTYRASHKFHPKDREFSYS